MMPVAGKVVLDAMDMQGLTCGAWRSSPERIQWELPVAFSILALPSAAWKFLFAAAQWDVANGTSPG